MISTLTFSQDVNKKEDDNFVVLFFLSIKIVIFANRMMMTNIL